MAEQERATASSSTRFPTAQGGGSHQRRDLRDLAPWFHNLHLPDGTQTAPDHPLGDFPAEKWAAISPHLPQQLRGWRVLDVGCNAGFYSFALADRGADVLGIDADQHYLRQARWASEQIAVRGRVRFEQMSVYHLSRLSGTFDLVWFMGVFYHLRYPLLGLDLAAQKVRRLMVFQSMAIPGEVEREVPEDLPLASLQKAADPKWPRMAFIENSLQGDATNWWAPNEAGVLAMLRSAGLEVLMRPAHETYLCRPS